MTPRRLEEIIDEETEVLFNYAAKHGKLIYATCLYNMIYDGLKSYGGLIAKEEGLIALRQFATTLSEDDEENKKYYD